MVWSSILKALKYNIACINQCTEVEGPFKRLAIWFQGCDKRCRGCCNPQLFECKPAHIISLGELIAIIENAKVEYDIEGVTYLGGEPTLQVGLDKLSLLIQNLGMGVILFTGNPISKLSQKLIESVDLIIDGEFEKDNVESERNLIGSNNQNIIFITERYRSQERWFYTPRSKQVEINVSHKIFITGDKF